MPKEEWFMLEPLNKLPLSSSSLKDCQSIAIPWFLQVLWNHKKSRGRLILSPPRQPPSFQDPLCAPEHVYFGEIAAYMLAYLVLE